MGYFDFKIENKRGVLDLAHNDRYTILSIEGLSPPTAAISTATNANMDGSTFVTSKVENRNIVINLAIEGNVEQNRIELYKFFKVKYPCKVLYKNGTRDVYINGYVETFECNFFEQKEVATISIICTRPYFIEAGNIDFDFASVRALFEFPFSLPAAGEPFSELILGEEKNVINYGDVETGMVVKFTAAGACENPAIYNTETNEGIKVNISLEAGDILEINTNKGEKGVYLNRNGTITNKINALDKTSTWLQLEAGDNSMLYTADANPENLMCNLIYGSLFEGV